MEDLDMYRPDDDTLVLNREGGGLLDDENGSFLLWRVNAYSYNTEDIPNKIQASASLFIGDCSRRIEIHEWGYTPEYASNKIDKMINELLMFKTYLVEAYEIREKSKTKVKDKRYNLC